MNALFDPGASTVPVPAIRMMTVSFFPARRFKKSLKPRRSAPVVALSSVSSRMFSLGTLAAKRALQQLAQVSGDPQFAILQIKSRAS
jgi:hypothetical protein